MYVILEGELSASVQRDATKVHLSTMKRGDTVGETGLFAERRSADVDVVSEARLVGFDAEDLDRLGRRYPRISSVIYRNLNLVQAQRLTQTTQRLR